MLALVLRGGVLFAAALFAIGLALHFTLRLARPLQGSPSHQPIPGLASTGTVSDPLFVLSFALFVLVGLPIARVVLSLVHFARERDWRYVFLTAAVLAVLLSGIIWGKAL
jgi:uncharacterized membrane protein